VTRSSLYYQEAGRRCEWCGEPTTTPHKVPMTATGKRPVLCVDEVCTPCYDDYKSDVHRVYHRKPNRLRPEDRTAWEAARWVINNGRCYALHAQFSKHYTATYRCVRWGRIHLSVSSGGDCMMKWNMTTQMLWNEMFPEYFPRDGLHIRNSVLDKCRLERCPEHYI
jgi:hypothetical protein